jgi:hypothetical protein
VPIAARHEEQQRRFIQIQRIPQVQATLQQEPMQIEVQIPTQVEA